MVNVIFCRKKTKQSGSEITLRRPPSSGRSASQGFSTSYHEDVKLVQAAERRLGDVPQGQDEADGGEGALPSRQAAHVSHLRRGCLGLGGLHLQSGTARAELCEFGVFDLV